MSLTGVPDCVHALQESGLKVNHPASFAVHLNGAQGKMEAKVHSPSGALEECVVTELDRGPSEFISFIFEEGKPSEQLCESHQRHLCSPPRPVRHPLHPAGERHPHHRCEVQRLSHPRKSLPGASRRTRTDWRAWSGFSVRSGTGERHHRSGRPAGSKEHVTLQP